MSFFESFVDEMGKLGIDWRAVPIRSEDPFEVFRAKQKMRQWGQLKPKGKEIAQVRRPRILGARVLGKPAVAL